MKNFKAVSMLCEREEQAKEMKKLCEKHGVEINYNWEEGCVLVNNQGGVNMSIGFVYKKFGFEFNRKEIPYNPIEFIRACGVEVEQPKWEKLTRGGFEYHIYEEFEGILFGRCKNNDGRWESISWFTNGKVLLRADTIQDLIPYNQRKTELLTKKAELEKQLEEINNELNQ